MSSGLRRFVRLSEKWKGVQLKDQDSCRLIGVQATASNKTNSLSCGTLQPAVLPIEAPLCARIQKRAPRLFRSASKLKTESNSCARVTD